MSYRLLHIGAVSAVAAMVSFAGAGAASAASGGAFQCSGGGWAPYPTPFSNAHVLPSGTYNSVIVSGLCFVPDNAQITIRGGVTVEPGGVFAALGPGTIHIKGGVSVGAGAIFALGQPSPEGPPPTGYQPSHDSVSGSITAHNALSVYLNHNQIAGHVSIQGGGPGADCTDVGFPPIGHDLVIKDNTISGGVTAQGWAGCWNGMLRNTVKGGVTWNHMTANLASFQGRDSTEIVANHISGSLTCVGNVPAAQAGDTGENPANLPPANQVSGAKRGECATL